jgi:hypothetical protein
MRLHLKRIIQVSDVAFLEQTLIWGASILNLLKFITIPIFTLMYYFQNKKKSYPLIYLTVVWFVVPWFALSMFRGELTPYYFAITRYVAIALISYIIYRSVLYSKKVFIPIFTITGILFLIVNMSQFFDYKTEGLSSIRQMAYKDFKDSRGNEFTYGAGKTYLYYFYEYRAYGKK